MGGWGRGRGVLRSRFRKKLIIFALSTSLQEGKIAIYVYGAYLKRL